jgi:vitamin B12 transporter
MKSYFHKAGNLETVVFRRWGRKRYSLFSTWGKLLKISVLSVVYMISVPVISISAESDTSQVKLQIDLEEVEVSASRAPVLYSQVARVLTIITRDEIERAPAGSLQDLLEYVAGVDIRQRGAEGVQADISIRGGSFDQTLILLNGINITDPQTGHHNLNLPVSISLIERIEILEGPAARVYGPNAFSGAVNIITRQPDEKSVSVQQATGNYGYLNSDISGSFSTGRFNHLLAANRISSDGYTNNTDFVSKGIFYSGRTVGNYGKISYQGSLSDKSFGANSFYTPVYPNQYEQVDILFTSIKYESNTRIKLIPSVYWRKHSDVFMLFRENAPEWYKNHNYHRTDVFGGSINSWFLWGAGKTSLGAEYRSEQILSNLLGEPMDEPVRTRHNEVFYTRSAVRVSTSVFIEHILQISRLFLTAGIMGNHISDYGNGMNFFPGLDMSYQLNTVVKFVASANSSMRMPTFTDLYYSGPVNIGNPFLKPERAFSGEGGIKLNSKFVKGNIVIFHRKGKDIIDWVKKEDDEKWNAMNHTRIVSRGTEVNLGYFPSEHLNKRLPQKIELGYLYNNQIKEEGNLLSYYVLDNLRHKLVASVIQNFGDRIKLDVKFIYQDRDGGFSLYQEGKYAAETPYLPFWLADVKGIYQYRQFKTYVAVTNIFNKEYYDLGNITQPGRWLKAGIQYKLNFN